MRIIAIYCSVNIISMSIQVISKDSYDIRTLIAFKPLLASLKISRVDYNPNTMITKYLMIIVMF